MDESNGLPPVLANWGSDGPSNEVLSFGAPGEEPPGDAFVWRVDLPAEPQQADAMLDGMAGDLNQVEAALAELPEQFEQAQPGEDEVSFSGGMDGQESSKASAGLQQVLDKVSQQLMNLAWVETRVEGVLLARTVVGWSGDCVTGWGELTAEQRQLHQKSLQLAVASRLALLNMVLTVIRGAGRISLLAATPGGLVLALPSAWQFASRFIAEAGKYRQLS